MFSLKAYIAGQQIYLHKAYSSNVDSIYSKKYFYSLLNLSTPFSSSFSQLCIKTASNFTWSHTSKTFSQWRKGPLTHLPNRLHVTSHTSWLPISTQRGL